MSFKAAAVQMCSGVDPAKNAAAMARLVREAVAQGATYVQTPEMTGMLQRDRAAARAVLADEAHDIIVKTGSELAVELGIHMHVGSTAIALADGKIANRGFLFGPDGRILNRYDKIHMFDVDLDNGESWRESAAYTAGSEARVLSLPFAEMGFAICYDVRFPALFRAQAMAGAEVMTVPARLHQADRRGALGDPPQGTGNRERCLHHRCRTGRPARGRARDFRPFDDHRSLGHGAGVGRRHRCGGYRRRDRSRRGQGRA
ncbi:putative amidohydrolase [Rhizobium leguminosarum]